MSARAFIKSIKDCIDNPEEPDSPVLESIFGRGSLYNLIMKEEIFRKIDGLISECNENIRLIDERNEILKKEKEFPSPPRLYSTMAIENLLISRYIDEKYISYEMMFKSNSIIKQSNILLQQLSEHPLIEPSTSIFKTSENVKNNFINDIKSFNKIKDEMKKII